MLSTTPLGTAGCCARTAGMRCVIVKPVFSWEGDPRDQTDIPTQSAPAQEDARIFAAHARGGWPQCSAPASRERALAADCVRDLPARVAVQRLRSPSEFRVVYREGRRLPGEAVILYVRPNGLAVSRAGVTTPRGVGSAVRRNRWRRRLREALRAAQRDVRGGFDLVLVPRTSPVEVPFTILTEAVRGLLEQAGVAPAVAEES